MADKKNHHVADIGQLLLDGAGDGDTQIQAIDLGAMLACWSLLRLPPKGTWRASESTAERTVLVLEGVATFRIDDWRHSAASGHLIVAGPGADLSALNDGDGLFVALYRGEPADRARPVKAGPGQ